MNLRRRSREQCAERGTDRYVARILDGAPRVGSDRVARWDAQQQNGNEPAAAHAAARSKLDDFIAGYKKRLAEHGVGTERVPVFSEEQFEAIVG